MYSPRDRRPASKDVENLFIDDSIGTIFEVNNPVLFIPSRSALFKPCCDAAAVALLVDTERLN